MLPGPPTASYILLTSDFFNHCIFCLHILMLHVMITGGLCVRAGVGGGRLYVEGREAGSRSYPAGPTRPTPRRLPLRPTDQLPLYDTHSSYSSLIATSYSKLIFRSFTVVRLKCESVNTQSRHGIRGVATTSRAHIRTRGQDGRHHACDWLAGGRAGLRYPLHQPASACKHMGPPPATFKHAVSKLVGSRCGGGPEREQEPPPWPTLTAGPALASHRPPPSLNRENLRSDTTICRLRHPHVTAA